MQREGDLKLCEERDVVSKKNNLAGGSRGVSAGGGEQKVPRVGKKNGGKIKRPYQGGNRHSRR